MLSTTNLAIQFGAKPLFEQVSVKFGDGNRYGLIGANGCGKSTLMKILGGELEPSAGEVMLQAGLRLGKLNQNQFGYEDQRVLDVVMQGHMEMWQAMSERDRIYADPDASDDGLHARGGTRGQVRRVRRLHCRGARGRILTDAGIDESLHNLPMREVAPGLKLRVLLAQALFSRPDVLLLDEPTNNLDINSIRWLEDILNEYEATMIIISHDRHFLNQVCTHIADLDFQQLKIYPGNYDDFMLASVQARQRVEAVQRQGARPDLGPAGIRAPLLGQRLQGAAGHLARKAAREDQDRGDQALVAPESLYPLRAGEEAVSLGGDGGEADVYLPGRGRPRCCANIELHHRGRAAHRDHRAQWHRQDHADALPGRRAEADVGPHHLGRERGARLHAAGSAGGVRDKTDLFNWMSACTGKADDDQIVRATLGRLLFSGDQTKKSVKVLSGGEKGRMIYGKLMLTRPERDAHGRAHQPHGHGNHRVAADRAREVPRHADLRVA